MLERSTRRSIITVLVILTIASVPGIVLASHSWGGYHWARTTKPFTLLLGDNLTSDWKAYLAKASSDWNAAPTVSPLITAVYPGQSNKQCRMVGGTTQVCNGAYGRNGWLGLASINIAGGVHITQGSAKMNDSYFNMSTYNNPNEKQHVICQEVAHTFGLDHQSENGESLNTCMDYFSNTGVNAGSTASTTPNEHDFEELRLIYAHLDSSTTLLASSSAATSKSDVTDEPNSWGALMSQSRNGRSSTYENYNADGPKR